VRAAVAVAGGMLVAVGGLVCFAAWAIAILAAASGTVDAAFVVVAFAGMGLSLGLVGAFAVLPLPWNIRVGGVIAAALFLIGVVTLLVFVGFVITPVAVLCVAAAAHAAGRPLRVGGLLLLTSFAAYGAGAWVLESAGEDGAYAVAAFVPPFGLAWIVLGYGITRAGLRLRPAS
jgi:hypothetical protein